MIKLLNIPGVAQIEPRLTLLPMQTAENDETVRRKVEAIAAFLGLGMGFWGGIDAPISEEPHEVETVDYLDSDAEIVEFWRRRGWDVSNADGSLLRTYRVLRASMISIEIGLVPMSKVELEAAIWKVERERNRQADPKQQKQNKSFLSLGEPRRRRAA